MLHQWRHMNVHSGLCARLNYKGIRKIAIGTKLYGFMPSQQTKLPWNKADITAAGLDGYLYGVQIKPSTIPNSGNGRFATQFIPKNVIICIKKIVSVYDDGIWHHDKTIMIKNLKELNILIERFVEINQPKIPRKEIIVRMHNFMFAVKNKLYIHP
eukprot:295963_1